MDLSSLNIRDLATNTQDENKKVLDLELNLISEDPDQPRSIFLQKELDEMADSIKERGVKSPISVRNNPNEPGKYIINHGARRYRASVLAAKKTIPSIIDNDYTFIDQIIENLQRQDLEATEICQAINKLIDQGMKKQDVAKALGVSNAYISQYSNLDKLPDVLQKAFDNKKIEDVTVINELMTLRKKNPDAEEKIDKWINKQDFITRPLVKSLRKSIETIEEVENTSIEDKESFNTTNDDLNTIEERPEIKFEPVVKEPKVKEEKNHDEEEDLKEDESLESLFLKPDYSHVEATTAVIALSKDQCATVLWAYNYGIETLDENAKEDLKAIISDLKDEINF